MCYLWHRWLLLLFYFLQLLNSLIKARVATVGNYSDADLPTISLCYPARNETVRIAETLTAALASTYPKLEILVVDDCSQDSTRKLCASLLMNGIRFIEGKQPKANWLGKKTGLTINYLKKPPANGFCLTGLMFA